MNANQAAAELGTDARTLRRFIRTSNSTFRAVGSGARYEFDAKDIPTLRKKFNEWRDGAKPTTERKAKATTCVQLGKFKDADEPMSVDILRGRLTRSQREARDAASRARVDRLEERLRASGKHISQYSNWGEKADA